MPVDQFEKVFVQVRRTVDDPDGIRWPDEVLRDYINEGQLEYCRESKTLRAEGALLSRENFEIYTLPDDLYETIRIERRDGLPLVKTSSTDLANRFGSLFRDSDGDPTHYYQDLDGPRQLRFWPRPADDIRAGFVTFDSEQGAIVAANDFNVPPIDSVIPFDSEEGVVTQAEGIPITSEDDLYTTFDFQEGAVGAVVSTDETIRVFYVRLPRENVLEIEDLRALRYYCLFRIYEEDSPFQDLQKAEFYEQRFLTRMRIERNRVEGAYGANLAVKGWYE